MAPNSLSRRALWMGGGCALAVLSIWTSFILVARVGAARTLTPFDIVFLRFLFSGLLVLPVAALRDAAPPAVVPMPPREHAA